MQITAEYLAQVRRGLEEQRLKGLGLVNQALGAMAMVDEISRFMTTAEPEALSDDDLKAMLGADEVSIVPMTKAAE